MVRNDTSSKKIKGSRIPKKETTAETKEPSDIQFVIDDLKKDGLECTLNAVEKLFLQKPAELTAEEAVFMPMYKMGALLAAEELLKGEEDKEPQVQDIEKTLTDLITLIRKIRNKEIAASEEESKVLLYMLVTTSIAVLTQQINAAGADTPAPKDKR